jgi:hypothetical protein
LTGSNGNIICHFTVVILSKIGPVVNIQSTIRYGIFAFSCAIASSSGFAQSNRNMIDVPPDHMNLWMAGNPLPWFKGEGRLLLNLAPLALAPKTTLAAFAASYVATIAADRYYGTGNIRGVLACSDEAADKAELMAPEMLTTSYLYCVDKTSGLGQFALDSADNHVEVSGRWGRKTNTLPLAIFMGRKYNEYMFVIEPALVDGLRTQCASSLGISSNEVSVRVKNTAYTTKTSGYKVIPFSEKQRDGTSCHHFLAK